MLARDGGLVIVFVVEQMLVENFLELDLLLF